MTLSICIPTYNRSNYLKMALESIQNQDIGNFEWSNIEVVISDNFSEDNTKEMVIDFSKTSKFSIKYFCFDKNYGADTNFLNVVSLANFDYCWFLGSDDMMDVGSLFTILSEIQNDYGILLCNRFECEKNSMVKLESTKFLRNYIPNKTFDFKVKSELKNYLDACESLGGVFSYISSIVFKKSLWNSITIDESYIGTAYIHVYVLLKIITIKKPKLRYISNPLILNRNDNDSFYVNLFQRHMLDINGYTKLATVFNDDIELKNDFLNILLRVKNIELLYPLCLFKRKEYEILLNYVSYSTSTLKLIKLFRVFGWVFRLRYYIKKSIKNRFKISIYVLN